MISSSFTSAAMASRFYCRSGRELHNDTPTQKYESTRYVKRKGSINMKPITWTERVIHVGPRFWTAIKLPLSVFLRLHMYIHLCIYI
jgi:hypothetical protein